MHEQITWWHSGKLPCPVPVPITDEFHTWKYLGDGSKWTCRNWEVLTPYSHWMYCNERRYKYVWFSLWTLVLSLNPEILKYKHFSIPSCEIVNEMYILFSKTLVLYISKFNWTLLSYDNLLTFYLNFVCFEFKWTFSKHTENIFEVVKNIPFDIFVFENSAAAELQSYT